MTDTPKAIAANERTYGSPKYQSLNYYALESLLNTVCKERISGKQSYIFNNYRANAAEEMKYHTICCYAEEPMPP